MVNMVDVNDRKDIAVCTYPEFFLYRKKEKIKEEVKKKAEEIPKITETQKKQEPKRGIKVKEKKGMECILIPMTGEMKPCIEDKCYFWDSKKKKCRYMGRCS